MIGIDVEFSAPLWLWQAEKGSWTLLTIPEEESALIRDFGPAASGKRRGFGAVKVNVRIGGSRWSTSIFPSKERGGYVLPIKKAVRTAEKLEVGDIADVWLEVLPL